MKFIIFGDSSYNYLKPMTNGLAEIIKDAGHECIVYHHGIYWLQEHNLFKMFFLDIYRLFRNLIAGKSNLYIYRFWNLLTFMNKKRKYELINCDCIIVVQNCPTIFYHKALPRIEKFLRIKYDKPIINYDLHYMPNQGWYKKIIENEKSNYGLERFDWYLCASIVTEFALPSNIPQIYSNIGFNIGSKDLYPEQEEFLALLDFVRPGYEKERKIQIQALKETNTNYIELSGKYTTEEIRKIYRKSNMYFLAVRESFGLPILELQLCGCYIFTPYSKWAPAHFINKDLHKAGSGLLGDNFFIYDNDIDKLKEQILFLKKSFNADKVISNLRKDYPTYYSYDKSQFSDFIKKLQAGKINSKSHNEFKQYNALINMTDEVIL